MSDSGSDLSTPPATDDEMPIEAPPPKATKAQPPKKSKKNGTILSFFDKEPPSPPRKKRAPSPPHEPAPEDNPDIAVSPRRVRHVVSRRDCNPAALNAVTRASLTFVLFQFIVMFRSRFSDAFPPKCPHLGPQDLERGVTEDIPTPDIESLLCALLGLVLNRKKPVESVRPIFPKKYPALAASIRLATLRSGNADTKAVYRKGHYGRALEEAIQTQKSQWPRSWNYVNPLHGGRSFNSMAPTDRVSEPTVYCLAYH